MYGNKELEITMLLLIIKHVKVINGSYFENYNNFTADPKLFHYKIGIINYVDDYKNTVNEK